MIGSMRYRGRGGRELLRILVPILTLSLVAAACGGSAGYVPAGMVRTPPPEVAAVSLPDVTHGTDMAFRADPGDVLVVYFGYTSCPDVCPTTMVDLRKAVRQLGDRGSHIEVAMATVDPDRDTPEVLNAYVHTFFPDGVALRTEDPDELAAAAAPFGASYEVTTNEEGYVEVVHTGFLYAVDSNGLLRLTWPFGSAWEDIATDLGALLDEESDNA